ncbi:hypothetical protein [Methylobacterium sp. JK268]
MGNRIGRSLLGLAALLAVVSPFVLILLLDPRIGLLARRTAPEPAPAVQAPAPSPAQEPGREPAQEPAREAVPSCPPCDEARTRRSAEPPERASGALAEPPPLRPALAPSPAAGGIATPDIAAERRTQRARLLGFVAHPDRVSGSAAWLDVIGLGFTAPRPAEARAYRPLAVDLAEAPDRAVLLLSEQPLAVTLTTRPADRAGALGLDSLAAFDLPEGRPDLLAGFRSAAFGAAEVAPLLPPSRFGRETLRGFCGALRLWAGRYGLGLERLRYTLFENAGQIRLDGHRIRSDGTARGRVSGRRLARICRF